MKILLTGANGLLGRCIQREFATYDITCMGNRELAPGMGRLDITDHEAVREAIADQDYSCIINCSANRDPESCLRNPIEAYKINAAGVEFLAEAASENGALLCHMSTDYVFSGENPPYREDAQPRPTNVYGRTKLAGEFAARSADKHLVIRIPALYRTDLEDERNCLKNFADWLRDGEPKEVDNECIRYYTLADEVAKATRFLIETEVEGIVHLTADQKTTKAEFCRLLAGKLGYGAEKIINGPTPVSGDLRPQDSHLSSDFFKSLGGPELRGVYDVLGELVFS